MDVQGKRYVRVQWKCREREMLWYSGLEVQGKRDVRVQWKCREREMLWYSELEVQGKRDVAVQWKCRGREMLQYSGSAGEPRHNQTSVAARLSNPRPVKLVARLQCQHEHELSC